MYWQNLPSGHRSCTGPVASAGSDHCEKVGSFTSLTLPLLAETCNPRAAEHLVRAADVLREDAAALDRLAGQRFPRIARKRAEGVALDARRLAAETPAVARRLVALALRRSGVDARRYTARHVAAVLGLATASRGRSVDLPGGLRAVRDRDAVTIHRARPC